MELGKNETLQNDKLMFEFEKIYKDKLFLGADLIIEESHQPEKWVFK